MRRLISAAVLAAAVAGLGIATAPAANACAGCEEFCRDWEFLTGRPCPLRVN